MRRHLQVSLHVGGRHKLGVAAGVHGFGTGVARVRKLTQKTLDLDNAHINKCETSDCMAEMWIMMFAKDGMNGRILSLMDGLGAVSRAALRNGYSVTAIEQDPEQFKISAAKVKDLPGQLCVAMDKAWRIPKMALCPGALAENLDKSYTENPDAYVPYPMPYIPPGELFSCLSNASYAPLFVRLRVEKVFFFAHHGLGLVEKKNFFDPRTCHVMHCSPLHCYAVRVSPPPPVRQEQTVQLPGAL